jgi:hypothetical protein
VYPDRRPETGCGKIATVSGDSLGSSTEGAVTIVRKVSARLPSPTPLVALPITKRPGDHNIVTEQSLTLMAPSARSATTSYDTEALFVARR